MHLYTDIVEPSRSNPQEGSLCTLKVLPAQETGLLQLIGLDVTASIARRRSSIWVVAKFMIPFWVPHILGAVLY